MCARCLYGSDLLSEIVRDLLIFHGVLDPTHAERKVCILYMLLPVLKTNGPK